MQSLPQGRLELPENQSCRAVDAGDWRQTGLPPACSADYWVTRLTLSITNEVCSDASSVAANEICTVWPL